MNNKFIDIIDKIILVLIKATIFFMPLFFLPWTSEFFEFNKQYLLWFFIPLILILWLVKIINSNEVKFRGTPLDIPLIIFLVLAGLSSFFSIDIFSSFFGYWGRFSDAWMGLLSFVLFYFVLINFSSINGRLKIITLIKISLFSYFLVLAVSLIALYGFFSRLTNNINIISAISFNPSGGSSSSLAIFIVIEIIILTGVLLNKRKAELNRIEIIFGCLALIFSLVLLFKINLYLSWFLLISGVIFLCFFFIKGILKEKNPLLKIFPLSFLIVLSLFMIFFPKTNLIIINQDLPEEITLDYKESLNITNQALKNNPILGSGLGTFAYNFSLYRNKSFNNHDYWQVRFDKCSSFVLEMIATGGILVVLSYGLVISLFLYLNIILIRRYLKKNNNLYLVITILGAFFLVFIIQFFYQLNTILQFLFWFSLALAMSFWRNSYFINNNIKNKEKSQLFYNIKINLKDRPYTYKIIILLIFVIFSFWFIIIGFEVKFWLADIFYAKGINHEYNLIKANQLNPYRYNYQISLAKYYLNQARLEAVKPQNQESSQIIERYIDKSINWGKKAVETNSNSVVAWETLAVIYRDIRLLTRGSELWAIRSFRRAFELEPSNPVLATELGKAYFYNDELEEAKKFFINALELKENYLDAKFSLAKVYLKRENDSEALLILNELVNLISDPEIYYEQGRIYYNRKEIDKAIEKFNQAVQIFPDYINALLGLGLSYDTKGNKQEALKYFKKVLELNQDNLEVISKIKELEEK